MLMNQADSTRVASVTLHSVLRWLSVFTLGAVLCWSTLLAFENFKLRRYVTVLEKNKQLRDKVLIAQYELNAELSKIISVGKSLPVLPAPRGMGQGGE